MSTKEADLADIYQEKTDIEHILDAPDTYIGSTESDSVKNWVLNDEGDMTYKDTFAYGGKKFDHLFLKLKANRIGEPFYHDASDGSLPEEVAVNWFKEKIFKLL